MGGELGSRTGSLSAARTWAHPGPHRLGFLHSSAQPLVEVLRQLQPHHQLANFGARQGAGPPSSGSARVRRPGMPDSRKTRFHASSSWDGGEDGQRSELCGLAGCLLSQGIRVSLVPRLPSPFPLAVCMEPDEPSPTSSLTPVRGVCENRRCEPRWPRGSDCCSKRAGPPRPPVVLESMRRHLGP
jgi:hypothetical protein